MRIIARDYAMVPINEIDMYSSFIWTDRYETNGDFELCVPCTDENYELFNKTKFITIDKSDSVMVVEKKNIKTKVDGGDEYMISGRSADTLLDRRVLMGEYTFGIYPFNEGTNSSASQDYLVGDYLVIRDKLYRAIQPIVSGGSFVIYSEEMNNGNVANIYYVTDQAEKDKVTKPVEEIAKIMLESNIITPSDRTRKFVDPEWVFKYSTDRRVNELRLACGFANSNLYDAISSLAVTSGCGLQVVYNEDTEKMEFFLYLGTDRSVMQSENLVVNFRETLDNVSSTNFITDDTNYKTCAYVYGATDDKKTLSVIVYDEYGQAVQVDVPNPNYNTTWSQVMSLGGTGVSYNRREAVIDASDISRYQSVSNQNGTNATDVAIKESDYRLLLKARGQEELMKLYSSYDLSAEIIPEIFYKYGEDYFLGDTISIEDKFGNIINASISEYIFSVDAQGYRAYPTIKTLGSADGFDQLVTIFVSNPYYVDANNCLIFPDIKESLQELREKTYISIAVRDILDYFLRYDGEKLVHVTPLGTDRFTIVLPDWSDMDDVILGVDINAYDANPNRYPDVNTKAAQFVKFMMKHQMRSEGNGLTNIPDLSDLASAIT